jgi:hypothetical protein
MGSAGTPVSDRNVRGWLAERLNTSAIDNASWILSVAILAVVIPASDKIASNDVFFAAHGVSPVAWIVLLVAGLVVVWLVLAGVLGLLRRWLPARGFDIVASILMLLITWFFVGNVLSRTVFQSNPNLGPLVGLVVAVLITLAARRFHMGSALFVFASIAAAIPLVMTVWNGSQTPATTAFDFTSKTPPSVLYVISDELQYPLAFNAKGEVRPELPNLRALSETATRYTHAYAGANYTDWAVPAQLTGISDVAGQGNARMDKVRAGLGIVPGMSGTYSIVMQSPIFQFECKEAGCASVGSDPGVGAIERYWSFAKDTAAIAGKTALAEPFASYFPSLDGKWKDFWSGGDEFGNGAEGNSVDKAIAGMAASVKQYPNTPLFTFWHTIRTHAPWAVDRQGNDLYPARLPVVEGSHMVGTDKDGKFSTTDLQYLERRLYADSAVDFDRQLGKILDELKATGRFDNTMVVVTADHGATTGMVADRRFGDNLGQRWGEVAHVPLVIKYPGQTTADVVTAVRSTGQIAQTVLNTVGGRVTDGLKLSPDLTKDLPNGPVFTTVAGGVMTPWRYTGVKEPNPWRQEDLAPPDPAYPYAINIDPALLGKPVPTTSTRMSSAVINALPGKSDQQVLVVTRSPGECPYAEAPSLISSGDTVIGAVLWEKTTATGSTDTRGWAIVPKSDPTSYRVYCSAS